MSLKKTENVLKNISSLDLKFGIQTTVSFKSLFLLLLFFYYFKY